MSILGKVKAWWLARKVAKKLQEDSMKSGFVKAAKALGLAVFPIVVLRVTDACPDLMTAHGALALVGGVVGAALLHRKGATAGASVATAGTAGLIGVAWTQAHAEISKLCGSDFLTQLPTILAAAVSIGLGAYLSHKPEPEEGK